ncbi:MAG: GNAT family N-acetyltransferase [Chloroflexi bacterium]|nr:GNAT family N-acetyltransferase [Chloroflexota bacterium]
MNNPILRDLGDGIVLRRSTPEDADALATFNAEIHGNRRENRPDLRVGAWVRDLVAGSHPTVGPDNFTIVEDTTTGQIVSSLCLISQTWTYEGIPFGVGQPELVGTRDGYRARGLVRAQFEVVHQWSAERGHLLQSITGIPFFYRQFGYEMCVNLGGGRTGLKDDIPALKEGETEPYRLRPATVADIPLFAEVYDEAARRSLLSCVRDEAIWRYDLTGRSDQSIQARVYRVIETAAGEPVGVLAHFNFMGHNTLGITDYEIKQGVSWAAVTPCILRYLKATGEEYARRDDKPFTSVGFWLGSEHPVYPLVESRLPRYHSPYAWYIRLADIPGFLRLIAPVLEQRLAASTMVGHTGELTFGFYRSGLKCVFEQGRLAAVEPWNPTPDEWGAVRFPNMTFLQLLFGYRSVEELQYAFPDCSQGNDEAHTLLNILFPKKASCIRPVA